MSMQIQDPARLQALLVDCVELQKTLMAQTNLIAEAHRHEAESARQRLMELAATLGHSAQRLERGGQQFGEQALQILRNDSSAVLTHSANDAIASLRAQAEAITAKLSWIAQAADEQTRQLTRAQTTMAWKAAIALGVGALTLAGGSTAWAWRQKEEAARYGIDAELGRRITQADIIRCGEGLCANVDLRAQRIGDRKQYLPVRTR